MKVIDLLNKIANGKEVPEKIRFDNMIWNKICGEKNIYYINDDDSNLFIYFFKKDLTFTLNDEVEIIEEPQEHKIPEKLDQTLNRLDMNEDYYRYIMENRFKINEILDYLEEIE